MLCFFIARKRAEERETVKAEGLHCPKKSGREGNGKSRRFSFPEKKRKGEKR